MDPVGTIASVIGIVGAIAKTYETIDKIVGLPKAFNEVKKDLPLVRSILEDAKQSFVDPEPPDEQLQVILAAVSSCSDKATELKRIFDEVKERCKEDEHAKDWTVVRVVYRKALRGIKAQRVETLMNEILEGLKKLALSQAFKSTIRKDLKAIEAAIEELAKVEPSLVDSEFDSPGTIHASQRVEHGATGQQNNSQGNDNTFNSGKYVTSGTGHTFNFVEHISTTNHGTLQRRGPDDVSKKEELIGSLFKVTYEDRKDRNEQRVDGTCQWFINHKFFRAWKDAKGPAFLWVSADPGCGKSVLAKYLIDEVLPSTGSSLNIVCYFFFKDDFEDQRSSENALCCILHQIFVRHPDLLSTDVLKEFAEKKENIFNSFSSLWKILVQVSRQVRSGRIICVLDALDECNDTGRSVLAKAFTELYRTGNKDHNLKFLVTSRPYENIRYGFHDLKQDHPSIHLSGDEDDTIVSEISREIDLVIKARVKGLHLKGRLSEDEAQLIQNKLSDPHLPNRTYLWVYLVFDEIQQSLRLTRRDLEQTLCNLPDSVSQAYENILDKSRDIARTRKLLHIIVAAVEPLSLHQMAVAMAIDADYRSYDQLNSRLEPDCRFREAIREICGLFVVVQHSRIYLLHQTAREFLIQTPQSLSSGAGFWKESLCPMESHCVLAHACIWMLLATDFSAKGDLVQSTFQFYAAKYWTTHFRDANTKIGQDTVSLTLPLLTVPLNSDSWFTVYKRELNRHLLSHFTPLIMASYFGLTLLVGGILKSKKFNLSAIDSKCDQSALSWACSEGHAPVVELLLRCVSTLEVRVRKMTKWPTVVTRRNYRGRTPLSLSALYGEKKCVELLLDHGAEIDCKDEEGETPLFLAANNGEQDVVQVLVERGAKVNRRCGLEKRTALHTAAGQWMGIVQVLLDHGANIHSTDAYDRTALSVAAENGREAIVRLLLKKGANIEACNDDGRNALSWASGRGHEAVVRLLLEKGAKIEPSDRNGWNALTWAIAGGHEALFRLLVERGAKTVAHRVLPYTAASGSLSLVRFLLDRGSDVDESNEIGRTALCRAASNGHIDVVRLLLDNGASVDARDWYGRTALGYAAISGYGDIIQLLLDKGASMEADDEEGSTPLHLAALSGNPNVVELLLHRGADPTAVTKKGETAMDMAGWLRETLIVDLLREAMRTREL